MSPRKQKQQQKSKKKVARRKCYNNLPPTLQYDRWLLVRDLGEFLKKFSGLDLNVQAVRTSVLEDIARLKYDSPFMKYVRFPKDRSYFCLSTTAVGEALINLQTALSVRDRRGEVNLSEGRDTHDGSNRDRKDALLAASKRYAELTKLFCDPANATSRKSFESDYPWEREEESTSTESSENESEESSSDVDEDEESDEEPLVKKKDPRPDTFDVTKYFGSVEKARQFFDNLDINKGAKKDKQAKPGIAITEPTNEAGPSSKRN